MERKINQPTFLDNVPRDLGGKRTAAFFAKCDQYIPWVALAEPEANHVFANDVMGIETLIPPTVGRKTDKLPRTKYR